MFTSPTSHESSHSNTTTSTRSRQAGETGYPWLFFYGNRSWITGLMVTLLIIGLGGVLYTWYSQSGNDTSPDSMVGLAYAVVGTTFLVLAIVLYSLRRRLRKRAIGQLHASLNWHMFFAIMGLAAIFMHSFGHFAPISGTFALYGMIALSISGLVGRILDRLMPRLITAEVSKVLNTQGEDRIASISQKLEAIVVHNTQEELEGFRVRTPDSSNGPEPAQNPVLKPAQSPHPDSLSLVDNKLGTPWDLAYISLEPTQQELDRVAPRYRFVPDKKSALTRPGALMPGAQEHITALENVQSAMQREQLYRYVLRYWRILHIALALITIGLVTWHLIFAAQLMFPGLFHP